MTQAMCTSFKVELFRGVHDFRALGGHQFNCALFTGQVVLNAGTTQYSPVGEVVSVGYVPGGFTLTNQDPDASGTTAMQSFSVNPTWLGVTFTASQALIYNVTMGNRAVAVFDFGGSQTVVHGTFTITLPPVTPATALLRLV
jgi:hypothetical protein